MCGIFGLLQTLNPSARREIIAALVDGLRRLEYRGYDSAGIALLEDDEFTLVKQVGNVDALVAKINTVPGLLDETIAPPSRVAAIAHTRWATHGAPSDINSHPHVSDPGSEFCVVHNGMVTNFDILKKALLQDKEVFISDTDTEVIAKLFRRVYQTSVNAGTNPTFPEIASEVLSQIDGAYAMLVISKHYPGEIIATRNGSPLVVGLDTALPHIQRCSPKHSQNETVQPGHNYLFSSDASALVGKVVSVMHLEDKELVHCTDGEMHYYDQTQSGELAKKIPQMEELTMKLEHIMKGNYEHFMLKEIFEQPQSLIDTTRGRLSLTGHNVYFGGISKYIEPIRNARRILLFGCGTSFNAASATRPLLEELTRRPVHLELATDFQDRSPAIYRDDVCIFVSQSGETKDTMDPLDYCLAKGALCVGITNIVGSSISRKTHCGAHLNCGPEIGVASTKAYTSQILVLTMIGLFISEDVTSLQKRRSDIIDAIRGLGDVVKETLESVKDVVRDVAQEYKDSKTMLLLGRGAQASTSVEGALKIKELAYIHSEGIHTGELKHGPLALVDENLPVVMICTDEMKFAGQVADSNMYPKIKSAVSQIQARNGKPIVICNLDDTDVQKFAHKFIRVPRTIDCLQSIVNVIPLQLLSYYLATLRGHNVDRPRSLAKSVTVN